MQATTSRSLGIWQGDPVRKPTATGFQQGTALVTVVIFLGLASIMLCAILVWATTLGNLSARRTQWNLTQYVAEAAEEKIVADIRNYVNSTGQTPSQNNLNAMATNLPASSDNSGFSSYKFLTTNNVLGQVTVFTNGASSTTLITSGTYAGLNALITPYRIIARATSTSCQVVVTNGIQRDIQVQQIPIFQFAIFYNMNMEIENGEPMTVNGKVHSNQNAYFAPSTTLTFNNTVTTVGNVYENPMPGDTHQTSWDAPTFSSPPTDDVPNLNLPISTNSTPSVSTNYHALIEVPPSSGTDPIASARLYDDAGLHILVSNSGITATDINGNNVSGITTASGIISTNNSLYDFREGGTVALTQIDISKLISTSKMPANGILYVADTRTGSSFVESAVRIVNGQTLPANGLSIITQNPIYILGNYNSTYDAPSAIFADAIDVLSPNWNDSNSNNSSPPIATATTVNAAFFAGIVPTTSASYSGGVENFPRFLENWSNVGFTYTGSMVAMFPSKTAVGLWNNANYSPPNRYWSFDTQFLTSTTIPPATPSIRTLRRITWVPTI